MVNWPDHSNMMYDDVRVYAIYFDHCNCTATDTAQIIQQSVVLG